MKDHTSGDEPVVWQPGAAAFASTSSTAGVKTKKGSLYFIVIVVFDAFDGFQRGTPGMTGNYEFDIEVCQGECGTDLRDPQSERIHSYPCVPALFVSVRFDSLMLLTCQKGVLLISFNSALGHSQAQARCFFKTV